MTIHPVTGFGIDFVVLLSEVITWNWPSPRICMALEDPGHPFTWPLNSQSILMESFWGLSFSEYNRITPNCTLDGTPPRGKNSLKQWVIWNKPCGCLMSIPGFHHYKPLTTDLSFSCILQQPGRGKRKKSSDPGLCMKRWGSKCQDQERGGRDTWGGRLGTDVGIPWKKGFPAAGFHFESCHHTMIRHKKKKKNHCLLDELLSPTVNLL